MSTYIDHEARAYNTRNGGHSRSNRKGVARFMGTSQLVTVRLGVPDTYFSIPANTRWHNKYLSGFVVHDEETGYVFWPLSKYEPWIIKELSQAISVCIVTY